MHQHKFSGWSKFIPLLVGLAFVIACGTAAPEPEEPPAAGVTPPPAGATQPPAGAGETPAPTAMPQATTAAPSASQPTGSLNIGQKETGTFDGHPRLAVNPGLFVSQTAPLGEGLTYADFNGEIQPWLAESWSVSPDYLT